MDPAQTTGASPPPELLELAELRSQLARYRAAFELSVPGQALIGLTGRFLEANASLCQILGYSQAELQSRRFRYITRPAISEQRLSISPQGRVRYQLKTPWRNGTTHVEWDAVDFIAKLAALVPPPRAHLTRFHGVFAPNANLRAQLTPSGRGKRPAGDAAPVDVSAHDAPRSPEEKRRAMSWAQRLKRVFSIDVTACVHCGGTVRIVASIEEPTAIRAILAHFEKHGAREEAHYRPAARAPPVQAA